MIRPQRIVHSISSAALILNMKTLRKDDVVDSAFDATSNRPQRIPGKESGDRKIRFRRRFSMSVVTQAELEGNVLPQYINNHHSVSR